MPRLIVAGLAAAAAFSIASAAWATETETLLVSNGQLNQPSTDVVLAYDASTGSFLGNFVTPGDGLNGPRGLAYGANGNLFVANNGGSDVLEYNGVNGKFIGDFVAAGSGGLSGPEDLTFHNGNLYVSSYNSGQVLEYNGSTGAFIGAAASGETGADGIAFNSAGYLFVAASQAVGSSGLTGTRGNELDEFSPTGTFVGSLASGFGTEGPRAVLFDSSGDALVSTGEKSPSSVGINAVEKFSSTGTDEGTLVGSGSGGLSLPRGLGYGPNGNLFVASQDSNQILEYNPTTGAFVTDFASGGGIDRPTYFTFAEVQQPGSPPPAVPLPPAAWSGLALLSALGMVGVARRKAVATF